LICLALSSSYPVSTAHIRFYTRLYSTFPVSPAATQQGTGTGSAQLGVRRYRREGAQRAVRGHPQETNCQAANQINQLIMRKQSQEPNVKCNSIRRSTTTIPGLFVHSIKKTPDICGYI